MSPGDDVAATRGRDEDVRRRHHLFHGPDLVTFHRRLKGADRIHFRNDDPGAETPHGLGGTLAHIAIAADHHHLAGHHDVRGPLDAVRQGLAAAVKVVELGFRHRIVDVDGGKEEFPALLHLVEAMDARCRLLRHPDDPRGDALPALGVPFVSPGQTFHDDGEFLVFLLFIQYFRMLFHLHALVNHKGGIAAVIHEQFGTRSVGPGHGLFGAPPVILQALPLPGEDRRRTRGGDRRGGVILGGEDVAGGPAQIRPEFLQGLDEHGRLDGHVEAAHDLFALKGFLGSILFPDRHKPRHLVFRQFHLLSPPGREIYIGHLVSQFRIDLLVSHNSSLR